MDEVTVALDGMGGDDAPAAPVAGALEAAREGVRVLLVGDEAALTAELARQGATAAAGIEVVHAPDVVGSEEEGARAVRAKPGSSVSTACRIVGEGRAGAAVSAGNTGATLAAATLYMRRIPGVKVVFMSGYTDHILTESGTIDSATLYLQKPFTVSQVAAVLRQAEQQ